MLLKSAAIKHAIQRKKKILKQKENQTRKSDNFKNNWPTYIGFFLISMAVLSYEVVINRMFAFTYWYHFAFMIISIALFGIGFGGLLVYFTNKFLKENIPIVLAILSIGIAVSFPLVLLKVNTIPLMMDQLGKDPIQDQLFIQIFLIMSIPFILSGFIFSFVFTNFKNDINRIYFFDLLGGGAGCIFALIIFEGRGPLLTAFILSILVIAAAAAFAFKQSKILALIIIPAASFGMWYYVFPQIQNTDIRLAKGFQIVEIDKTGKGVKLKSIYGKRVYSYWDNFAFVAVHETQQGVSHSVDEDGEGTYAVHADYFCSTPLMKIDNKLDPDKYRFKYFSEHDYPYIIRKNPETVCIIGVGGGKDVIQALGRGAREVYGAEINKTIYKIFSNVYDDLLGNLSKRTNVHIFNAEGRFFIRSSARKYDVIVFDNAISQLAVSSGAFTLAESYLYTREAIEDYLKHLKTGGVIYFSGPITDATRYATELRAVFQNLHMSFDFTNSVFFADNQSQTYQKCKVIVKYGAFTRKEADALVNQAKSVHHLILYAPYRENKSTVAHLITTPDIEREYRMSSIEIRPSTDDWPFFTQRLKPDMEKLNDKLKAAIRFRPEPFLMLRNAALQVSVFACLFLLLPLLFLNLKGFSELKNKLGSIIYFASLGMGFMLIEVVLIQKYQLVLGHPIYAFSIVLAGLLISSGVGSLFSERFKDPYYAILAGVAGMAAATALSYMFSRFLAPSIVGYVFGIRVAIILVLVSMNGFFMGFLMPSGIRAVSKVEDSIPWMWAINSVFSVLAEFFIDLFLNHLRLFICTSVSCRNLYNRFIVPYFKKGINFQYYLIFPLDIYSVKT